MSTQKRERVLVIACGVLRLDIEAMEDHPDIDIDTDYLDGGLHDVPNQLRAELQSKIDAASATEEYDRIAIGYGICGRGTVGLHARNTPLTIPKVHDCIALFLGSDSAYRREFQKNPGTYYISGGWFEEQVQPQGNRIRVPKSTEDALRKSDFEYFKKKYGQGNAEEISRFYNSWQKNYSRAGFIDTGAGDADTYGAYARDLAKQFDWEFEKMEGTDRLIDLIISGDDSTGEILFVPAEHVTEYDPKGRGLVAVPVREKSGKADPSIVTRRVSDKAAAPTAAPENMQKRRLGLGIDAGGTYTDAAIYDYAERDILGKGKGRTTKWDFTIGIEEAISKLDRALLSKVDLVSVSTTLATNAIVEGYGQKVGLILMPMGSIDLQQIENESTEVIAGRLNISGQELEPLDPEEVKQVVRRMCDQEGVKVFAVSGYAGAVNPEHELTVKKIITDETGLHVCCGHELSDMLNFYVRANTAVLNARIIPLLETFLEDIEQSLANYGINAPVMVVKGDGSLMSGAMAKDRPIETILSGPAASIAGARFLTGLDNATIVDVGGTTSDIGCISGGAVEVCATGAKVGGWRTHVRALDMSTLGLGGDSEIKFQEQQLHIGPRRIAPMSWLGTVGDISDSLTFVEGQADFYQTTTLPLEFFIRTGSGRSIDLTEREQMILDALEDGPCSVLELARRLELDHWLMLSTARLEDAFHIQRCGPTPTDVLHCLGKMDLWDRESAERIVKIIASKLKMGINEFCGHVFEQITDKLITELMKKQLELDNHADSVDSCPACAAIIANILGGGSDRFRLTATFLHPVVGLGAPVSFFTEGLPAKVEGEVIIPDHADVANAVGAITSNITVQKRLRITPGADGNFILEGVPGNLRFPDFEEANEIALMRLQEEIAAMAVKAGTTRRNADFDTTDRITTTADGAELFLERTIVATISGPPDLA